MISIPCLNKFNHSCAFGNGKLSLFQYSNIIGTDSLVDNLYKLDLHALKIIQTLHASSYGIKHKLLNENSSMLWHKCLGHISKQRIQRLVSKRILNSLDFSYFEICIDCIKRKQIDVRKVGANRSLNVLELIHIDIGGPFPTASWNGQ